MNVRGPVTAAPTRVSRAELEENLEAKRADPTFAADVGPLLVHGVAFDRDRALDLVLARLVALVPGAPWTPPTRTPTTCRQFDSVSGHSRKPGNRAAL